MRLLFQDEKLMHLRHWGLGEYILNPYETWFTAAGDNSGNRPYRQWKNHNTLCIPREIDNEAHNVITIEDPLNTNLQATVRSKLSQRWD
ncbi:MAG: hypothetical protein Ct9H300mP28_19790 [Pseudomonadota bacterium]|nr:MAG: hypothetical protein Ct9H300mP28_19790 [Pseudomonadota bacterium]